MYTRNTLASYSTLIKYSFIKTNASIYTGDIFLLKFHLHAYFMDTQKKKKILQNLLQNFAEVSEYKLKRRFPLPPKPKPDVNTNNISLSCFWLCRHKNWCILAINNWSGLNNSMKEPLLNREILGGHQKATFWVQAKITKNSYS